MVVSWRDDAACRESTSMFFHQDQPSVLAFGFCSECPVRVDCLTEALDRHWTEDVGIWGFTTPRQRKLIRQRKLTLAQAWDGSAAWLMEWNGSNLLEQEVARGSSGTEEGHPG